MSHYLMSYIIRGLYCYINIILTLSSCVLLKLPFFIDTPNVFLEMVQSWFRNVSLLLATAFIDSGLLLKGMLTCSDFLICYSVKSTFKLPILKNDPNDFFSRCLLYAASSV